MSKKRRHRREAPPQVPEEKPGLSRRALLLSALALGAMAAEEATVGVVRKAIFGGEPDKGSTNIYPVKPELEPTEESVEYLAHEPPKIEFTQEKNVVDPELPEDVEAVEIDSIARQLYEKLEAHFMQAGANPRAEQFSPSYVLNVCVTVLQQINPAFTVFLTQQHEESNKDPYVFLKYINQYLLRSGYYLFTDFHVSHYTNLHKVDERGGVVIDGKKKGMFVVLDRGVLDDTLLDMNAVVIPEMPDVIHMWPHKNENIIEKYRKNFGDKKTPAYKKAIAEGFKYHEAVHIYLEEKYPQGISQSRRFVEKEFHMADGLNLSLSGSYIPGDLQELCAVGAQLAHARHPHEILGYIHNTSPNYGLAVRVLVLSALKFIPDSSVREHNMASLRSEATSLNPNEIADYFRNTENLETIHEVGRCMYNIGVEMFEAMFPRKSG